MALYTVLSRFTEQGARNIKDTVHRAEALEAHCRKLGITIKSLHWTSGHYDIIAQFEAPDEKTLGLLGLTLTAGGNVRTVEVLPSFTRDEVAAMIGKLP
jgi:uncharacterized protein with GYD domain